MNMSFLQAAIYISKQNLCMHAWQYCATMDNTDENATGPVVRDMVPLMPFTLIQILTLNPRCGADLIANL